jgi:hypothetical protein
VGGSGEVDRIQVGALPVAVEDDEDLGWSVMGGDGVRRHGGELCRLSGFDQDDAVAEVQSGCARQHREPVAAGVHAEFGRRSAGCDAHLGHGHALRPIVARQQPAGDPVGAVASRSDDHVVVSDRLHKLIESGTQGARDGDELVDGDAPMPGLDPAQRGCAHVAARGQRIQRPAAGETKAPDARANHNIEIRFLRHPQDCMPNTQ